MQVVLRLPTTPTVQGGWTTCARVRRLSMPIACLSSAMASASHGTGHGVAVGRGRSGRRLSGVGRFFRFRPLLRLLLQQANRITQIITYGTDMGVQILNKARTVTRKPMHPIQCMVLACTHVGDRYISPPTLPWRVSVKPCGHHYRRLQPSRCASTASMPLDLDHVDLDNAARDLDVDIFR